MKKMIALLLATMMLLALSAGCSGDDKPAVDNPGNNDASQPVVDDKYDVIRFGHAYDATTLDPQNCYDDGSYFVLNNVNEGLVKGYGGEIHPGIAESWDISDDGMVYTFHLRDAKWSDGTPLTAHDFVYSAKRILNPETAFEQAATYYNFKNGEKYHLGDCTFEEVGIKALDERTLECTLEDPTAVFLHALASYAMGPVKQEACEAAGEEYGAEADSIVTSGPFTVTEWLHESKITLKKNEHYWDADNIHIDEIQFIIGAESQVAVDLFMAGELDVGLFTGNTSINTLNSMGLNSISRMSTYYFAHLNCAGHDEEAGRFMGNANFRKALSCAIGREEIMLVSDVVATPSHRIMVPTLNTASGKSWDEEYPLNGWSASAEPEKAKQYLDLALQEIGATVEEVPVLEMLCFDSQNNLDKYQAMQDMILQNLGINCVINPQPIQQMLDMVDNGQFDFWLGGKPVTTPDWLDDVGSEYDSTYAGAITGYVNPEYSRLADEASKATDMKVRNELLYQMEQIIVNDMTTLSLYWLEECTMFVPELTGIEDCNGLGPYFANCRYVTE